MAAAGLPRFSCLIYHLGSIFWTSVQESPCDGARLFVSMSLIFNQ